MRMLLCLPTLRLHPHNLVASMNLVLRERLECRFFTADGVTSRSHKKFVVVRSIPFLKALIVTWGS